MRGIRVAAVLLPAALLLHEAAYVLAGGGLLGAHHYLEVLVPLAAALAGALALGALVLPALGTAGRAPREHAPLALAAALLGVFVLQELAEALILGGGMRGLAASAAVAWLAPPLALLLGALATALVGWLERTGDRLARLDPALGFASAPEVPVRLTPAGPMLAAAACGGLSFGFARRPPPLVR